MSLLASLAALALAAPGASAQLPSAPGLPDADVPSAPSLPSAPKTPSLPSEPPKAEAPSTSEPVGDAVGTVTDTVREAVGIDAGSSPLPGSGGGGTGSQSDDDGRASSAAPAAAPGGDGAGQTSTRTSASRNGDPAGRAGGDGRAGGAPAGDARQADAPAGGPAGRLQAATGEDARDGGTRGAGADGGRDRDRDRDSGGAPRTGGGDEAEGGAGDGVAGAAGGATGDADGPGGVLASVRDGVRTLLRPLPDWSRPIIGVLALLVLLLGARSLVTGARVRRLRHGHAALAGDLAVLQQALVPDVPERLGGLRLSVAYRAADGLAAGGDFYDAFALDDDRVALVLGDVSGHDRTAIARGASVRHKLRAYLELGMEPRAALRAAGEALAADSADSAFVTAIVAVHDRSRGTLTYAAAGHPPPILTGPAAHAPLVAGASPPLGWGLPTGLRQTSVVLTPGSAAVLFTDGLVEARTGDEQLGREGLAALVDDLGEGGAPALLEGVMARADRAEDDLAALVARPCDPVTAAPERLEELEVPGGPAGAARAGTVLRAWGLGEDAVERAAAAVAAAGPAAPVVLRLRFDPAGALEGVGVGAPSLHAVA